MDAAYAITTSLEHHRIVEATYTHELARELYNASTYTTETAGAVEYWGTDATGEQWCVRLFPRS